MPVEIREMVIQAQIQEQSNNAGASKESIANESIDADLTEKINDMVSEELLNLFPQFKSTIMDEMKIWFKDYIERDQKRY